MDSRQAWQRRPEVYRVPPLPPGTRVMCRVSRVRGVVSDYDCSIGQFPVDWANGFQEICLAHEVTVLPAGKKTTPGPQ